MSPITLQVIIDEIVSNISIQNFKSNTHIKYNSEKLTIDVEKISKNTYSLILDGKSYIISVSSNEQNYEVTVNQNSNTVRVMDEQQLLLKKYGFSNRKKDDSGKVYAQIPGMISEIYVKKGDNVNINDKLFILEAMKMENEIASSVKGTIKEILVKPGISVEKGSLIMEIQN